MPEVSDLTPNQIVAYNLVQLRSERGWSEGETARKIGDFLGRSISVASYSAMERSVEGRRVKRFDADEIFALARAFGVPVWRFFAPPINYKLKPVRVRPRTTPAEQALSRTSALLFVAPVPEQITAQAASLVAGPSTQPKPPERLDPNNPVDWMVARIASDWLLKPLATSALEEQQQMKDFLARLREVADARGQQPSVGENEPRPKGRAKESGHKLVTQVLTRKTRSPKK
jgi:transcriptional regulator with XRE-family HTH domain